MGVIDVPEAPEIIKRFLYNEFEWAYEYIEDPVSELERGKLRAAIYNEWPPSLPENAMALLQSDYASLHLNGVPVENYEAALEKSEDRWILADDSSVSFASYRTRNDKGNRDSWIFIDPQYGPDEPELNKVFQEWWNKRGLPQV